ncbi:unnamed protein product [Amoebophrya sp. A120]|nr:unnamed protein product [Amoebophrya sp. A120]|eukprot:GSA120T00005291001.1
MVARSLHPFAAASVFCARGPLISLLLLGVATATSSVATTAVVEETQNLAAQQWEVHTQTWNLHRKLPNPQRYMVTMYRDEYGKHLQYTHLQGNERDLSWIKVCRNATTAGRREVAGDVSSSTRPDGTTRTDDCDWYTAGQAYCTYENSFLRQNELEVYSGVVHQESKQIPALASSEEDKTSAPSHQQVKTIADVQSVVKSAENFITPTDFNNCEIPHLHTYNASRFYQRIHEPDRFYSHLMTQRNKTLQRFLPDNQGRLVENPFFYPQAYREALDFSHFGGGSDTLIRQLYFCPGDAPLAILLLPKAGSSSGQRFVWRYETDRLKQAVKEEFHLNTLRVLENDRYKEAYGVRLQDLQDEQAKKAAAKDALVPDEDASSTSQKLFLDTGKIRQQMRENPTYSGNVDMRSEQLENAPVATLSRAELAKLKRKKLVSLTGLLVDKKYRAKFNREHRPALQDLRVLEPYLVFRSPRCPLCCRDQKWRRKVIIARNPYVRFVSGFFYLLRQALLRTDTGLPRYSYWYPAGLSMFYDESAYECDDDEDEAGGAFATPADAKPLGDSGEGTGKGMGKLESKAKQNAIAQVSSQNRLTHNYDQDPDLKCPSAFRKYLLRTIPNFFSRFLKIVLSWRVAYGNKGFKLNLGRFTTDEAHDILHVRPASDILSDPWLTSKSLDRSVAEEYFPTDEQTIKRKPALPVVAADEAELKEKMKSNLFVVHLEHKSEDETRLHKILCEEDKAQKWCISSNDEKKKKTEKFLPADDVALQKALSHAKENRDTYERSMQTFSLEYIAGCRWSSSLRKFQAPACSESSTELRCACSALEWKKLWTEENRNTFLKHFSSDFEILQYGTNVEDLLPLDDHRSRG